MSLQEIRDHMSRAGVLLGSVRIGGVDFAYAQVPQDRDMHSHWFMGADRNGLRAAGGWRRGTLTDAGANPTQSDIAARLEGALTEPRDERTLDAATTHLLRPGTMIDKLTSAVSRNPNDAWRLESRMGVLVNEALEPLKRTLGKTRLRIAGHLDGSGCPHKGLRLTPDEVEGALRFEALRPWAAPFVLGTGGVDYLVNDDGILRHALELKGLNSSIARRLGPATGRFDLDCARMAAAVPIDWIPASDDARGWAGFRILAEMLSAGPGTLATRYGSLLAPVRGRWADYALKLANDRGLDGEAILAGVPDVEEGGRLSLLRDYVRDTSDMMLSLDFWAGNLPIRADWNEDGESVEENLPALLLVGDRGLGSFLEISRAWHADPAFHERTRNGVETAWDPILPDHVDEATGIRVEVLKGSLELAEEGARGLDRQGRRGLHHCVGGDTYVEACESERVRIVSMRRYGERLSTAEVQLGGTFSVRQHRGWKNGDPAADAEAALGRYMQLAEVRAAANAAKPTFRQPRFTSAAPVDVEATFELWRPYLAGEFRNMDLDEVIEALGGVFAPTP